MYRFTPCAIWSAVVLTVVSVAAISFAEEKPAKPTIVYDEAKQGDLGEGKPDSDPVVRVDKPGVYLIQGTGVDAVDDMDAFVFEVAGEKPFDFCLIADAAEFKKLYSIDGDGNVKEIAFGSTNPKFRVPRDIAKMELPPGKYRAEMMFGPQGAIGEWIVKIAPRNGSAPDESFCTPPPQPSTAEKMKEVDWPGAIAIYHGHNWGDDKKYITAIKEAGYGATGAAEWQIEECGEQGLRAFVFIWPHEATTIPPKYQDNKTVLSYYLSDRITPDKWASWASSEKLCYRGDVKHPAFFTMRALWGGIDQFCPVVRGRAMEFYHYHWDGNRHPERHFMVLEQYRKASAENGWVPVCRIVEVRPEDMRKTRQTVYTSLAYGLRGFRMGGHLFDGEKRDERGVPSRNAYGEEMKKINAAINAYSPVFEKARCQAVYHTEPLPAFTSAAPDDAWVKPEGKEVCVGIFRDPEAEADVPSYLLVANRDAFNGQAAVLNITGKDAKISRMDKTTGKWVDCPGEAASGGVQVKLELEDGSGELLKVTGADS